jgi:hypothetical protein
MQKENNISVKFKEEGATKQNDEQYFHPKVHRRFFSYRCLKVTFELQIA